MTTFTATLLRSLSQPFALLRVERFVARSGQRDPFLLVDRIPFEDVRVSRDRRRVGAIENLQRLIAGCRGERPPDLLAERGGGQARRSEIAGPIGLP